MPTYKEAKQINKSAQEMQRKAAEAARKRKYNPDGTPRNTGANEY